MSKIGWIFTDVAHLDLEERIPVIASSWATNLLGSRSFKGGRLRRPAKVQALRVANAFHGRLRMHPVADEPVGSGPVP
jgi:hypothetical protein